MSAFGPYELLSAIGRGSATEVYRAKRFGVEGFEKILAVKRLLPEALEDPGRVERFISGAQRSLRLGHSNVVGVLELGEAEEAGKKVVFIATELVNGATLDQLITHGRPNITLPPGIILHIFVEVARALDHAHRRRGATGKPLPVFHGGLTANNVFLTAAGEVKVSDFCVAGLGYEEGSKSQPSELEDLFRLLELLRDTLLASSAGAEADEELLGAVREIERSLREARDKRAAELHEELLLLSYGAEHADRQDLASLVSALRRGTTLPPPAAYTEELARPTSPSSTPEKSALKRDFGAFVARTEELTTIGRRLAIAAKRKLQVISIVGDPGVGKTRLVAELRERLKRSAVNVAFTAASCPEHGAAQPGSALTAMLRSLFGIHVNYSVDYQALVPALGALGLSGVLSEAVASELEALTGPTTANPLPLRLAIGKMMASLSEDRLHVFVFDAAENMDDESARLLAGVIEDLGGKRLAVILCRRSGVDSRAARIEAHEEISLGPFSEEDQIQLVRVRTGLSQVPEELAEFIKKRAQGHAMHVDELLREALHSGALEVTQGAVSKLELSAAFAVPDTLTSLVSNRARRLGKIRLDVLRAVATLGEFADAELVAEAVRSDAESVSLLLDELSAEGLVAWTGQRAYLPSALVLEALTAELTEDQRSELWRRSAEALEQKAPLERRRLSEAAWRFEEAGDLQRAAQAYERAALAPNAGAGIERSVPLLLRALSLVPLDARSDSDLASSLAALADRVRLRQDQPDLLTTIRRVSAHWVKRKVDDDALKIDALRQMAQVLAAGSHYLEANKLLLSASEIAAEKGVRRAQVALALADSRLALGEFDEALLELDTLGDAEELSRPERHEAMVLQAHAHAGQGDYSAALVALEQASAQRGTDRELSCRAHQVAALVYALRGDWQNSARAAATSALDAQATGKTQQEISSAHYLGEALMFQEQWARAYAAFRKSLALATDAGAERWVNRNRMLLGFLEAREGSANARQAVGQCLAEAERTRMTQDVAKGRLLIAKLLAQEDNPTRARRETELAREIARSIGHTLLVAECESALEILSAAQDAAVPASDSPESGEPEPR